MRNVIVGSRLACASSASRPVRRTASNRPGSFATIVQAAVCAGKYPRQAFDIDGLDPQVVSRAYFVADASE